MKNRFVIDWKFIHQLEGYKLNGYVPKDSESSGMVDSGVTVCAGFDLGQQTRTSLEKMNLPKEIFQKVVMYAGVKGMAAKDLLSKYPLKLTEKEADTLSLIVENKYAENLIKTYNTASKKAFNSLTTPQQTVIMSVAYQYGNLPKRCPRFWKLVTNQNWVEAVKELRNFGDAYSVRRNKEANFLEKGIY